MRRLGVLAVTATLVFAVLLLPSASAVVGGQLERITEATGGGGGLGASGAPAMSGDGMVLAFTSDAVDLVATPEATTPGVFVSPAEGETRRIAAAAAQPSPCGPLPPVSVSGDGTTVAFVTDAALVDDGNDIEDVYAYDVATGALRRISVAADGGDPDGPSCAPALDREGSVVAFDSEATNLVAGDGSAGRDVFVAAEGGVQRLGPGLEPDVDAAGRRIAYETDTREGAFDVVVADLDSSGDATQAVITTRLDGGVADGDSYDAVLSGDGETIAFTSDATNLVEGDGNARSDVFAVELASLAVERVSLTDDGAEGDADSFEPALGADGSTVAFATMATLASGDGNGAFTDVVVRDREAGRTRLASGRPDGTGGDDISDQPVLVDDGLTVAFASNAANLIEDDTSVADIFVRRLPAVAPAPSPGRPSETAADTEPEGPGGGGGPDGEADGEGEPGDVPDGDGEPGGEPDAERPVDRATEPRDETPTPDATPTPTPEETPDDRQPGDGVDDRAELTRRAGASRLETAVELSREAYPDGSETVVLARADTYPDALAGAPLAHMLDAPILLTPSDELPAVVAGEVARLGATTAVLLGGEDALTPPVEQALLTRVGIDDVERYAGADRFATAAVIASELGSERAYVVEGANPDPGRGWPDALAVAPLAALRGDPILLATRDELPEASRAALVGRDAVTIVGGEAAVSADVEDAVAELVGGVDRVAGATRFDTAVRVAEFAERSGASAARTTVATGGSFADALVAGPVVAREEGVLLLVPQSSLDEAPSVRAYLDARRGVLQQVRVLGGTAAVSEAVAGELRALLEP